VILAWILQQGVEEFAFEQLLQQLSRFAILALFFIGPLLKSIFGKKEQGQPASRKRRRPTARQAESEERAEDDLAIERARTRKEALEPLEELPAAWREELPVERASVPSPVLPDLPPASLAPVLEPGPVEVRSPLGLGLADLDREGAQRRASARVRRKNLLGWRQALVQREVLGPPVALRSSIDPHTPLG
jgi:hypothetical protein